MTQIKVSRLVEVAKILTTKSGQELQDFVQYVADLAEQVVRALRNGLSFTDNMDATFKTVSLVSGSTAAVNVGTRRPAGIWPVQVVSTQHGWESFHWYIDGAGQAQVLMTFTSTPGSVPLSVVLLIIYG